MTAETDELERTFGDQLARDASLARYTSARIGGPADYLLQVDDSERLAEVVEALWRIGVPFRLLGGGSNVLIADAGVRGVIVLNRARAVEFRQSDDGPSVWAESGATLGVVGRRAAERGLTGMEWAATVPGTVGGAVVGNAGAHDGDTANALQVAEILQRDGQRQAWTPDRLEFDYRTSWLKRHPGEAVVLSASFRLEQSTVEATSAKVESFTAHRRATQPGGASWGSMFKNPIGDFAGRLIDRSGLKGLRRGGAVVSDKHANFFVNDGEATAEDAWALIREVRRRVAEATGVELELEIERLGDWNDAAGAGG